MEEFVSKTGKIDANAHQDFEGDSVIKVSKDFNAFKVYIVFEIYFIKNNDLKLLI